MSKSRFFANQRAQDNETQKKICIDALQAAIKHFEISITSFVDSDQHYPTLDNLRTKLNVLVNALKATCGNLNSTQSTLIAATIITEHFTELTYRLVPSVRNRLTLFELEKNFQELDLKLHVNPPNETLRLASYVLAGAIVGFAIGLVAVIAVTAITGGFAAIPAAFAAGTIASTFKVAELFSFFGRIGGMYANKFESENSQLRFLQRKKNYEGVNKELEAAKTAVREYINISKPR